MMNDETKKYHPASFEFKWLSASEVVKNKYITLTNKVTPKTDEQKTFLLWMSNQDKNTCDIFLSFFND